MARDLMIEMFIPHAVELYLRFFAKHSEKLEQAKWMAGHILTHPSKTLLTERDLRRASHWEPKRVQTAMETLIPFGWVTIHPKGWEVNSAVHTKFAERAVSEKEARKRATEQAANANRLREKVYGTRKQTVA